MTHRTGWRRWMLCIVCAAIFLLASAASASPTRILVSVGQGVGNEAERPLQYAERDAVKVVGALTSLGGVAPGNVILLRKPSLSQLRAAFAQARAKAGQHARADVTFIFYFSGHGDRSSLHLADESLAVSEVRRLVQGIPARFRLVVLDACRGSRAKGMSTEPGFAISLGNPSGTSGTAWLFASADGEASQESDQLGGAVFTSAWLTGLRGAADGNGDRRVTLAESYQYAYHQTLYRTARGSGVLQRPSAQFDLEEVAPVTLTRLGGASGFLLFPKEADAYYLVFAPRSRTVVAEVWSAPAQVVTLGLPPGRYVIHRRKSGAGAAAEVAVSRGEERALASSDFREVPLQALARKGGTIVLHPWELEIGYGVHVARTQDFGQRLLLRSAYRFDPFALSLALEAGQGHQETPANDVDERWVGAAPSLELRVPLGMATLRFGLGPSLHYVGQAVRRKDADRVKIAGYLVEHDYAGFALGVHGLAGLRLPLPFDPVWVELDGTGSWHEAKSKTGLQARWQAGGSLSLGASF